MVASVYRVEPHVVFDRHRTETGAHDVLATGDPSTTFLIEPGERPFQADTRLSRRGRSARRVHRLVGLNPFGNTPFFKIRLKKNSLSSGRRKAGGIGIDDGAPETPLAASSKPRVTCSTT